MMKTSVLLAALCDSYHLSATLAFTQPRSTSIVSVQESRGANTYLDARRNSQDDQDAPSLTNERRRVLFQCATSLLAVAVPSAAQAASSELFKPNPLTNTALEKIRIWNQDEVDNIKYGGELESGSAKPGAFEQYVDLLQPILGVKSDLDTINQLISGTDKLTTKEEYIAMFEQVNEILSHEIFVKIQFKKAFNAFADNIYYSDPDRANLYLGGGAVPQSTQTLAYLLRNDVLTTTEDMRAETTYLLKELNKKSAGETIVVGGDGLDLDEMRKFTKIGTEGMVKYLALVPPEELDAAKLKFNAKR